MVAGMPPPAQPADAPHRFRDAFPYHALPRARFQTDETPMAPAPERWITDTTFRDGQQARAPFTPDQVLHLYDALHRLDRGSGTIRQCEFFLYSDDERTTVRRCLERGYRFPEVTAWIRARPEDLRLVAGAGLRETGLLTSVSDLHIARKLGLTRQAAMDRYLAAVDAALEAGLRPRCHFEDVTRADIGGFVVPFAAALMERGARAGVPIKIRLCDTMGVALPWPGAALPRGVPKLVQALILQAGVPSAQLEWHGHNDFFKGHANAATAWLYGCAAVNTTLLGLGERCGNSPLEAALVEHIGLRDAFPGARPPHAEPDLPVLAEIAGYLRDACDAPLPANYPLLGAEAFTTRAGVHIDGLLKDPETYLSFDPQTVLGRPIGVVVSDRSGAAGIAWWLNARRGATGLPPVHKADPSVQAIHAALLDRYAAGDRRDPSDDELRALAQRAAPGALPDDGH